MFYFEIKVAFFLTGEVWAILFRKYCTFIFDGGGYDHLNYGILRRLFLRIGRGRQAVAPICDGSTVYLSAYTPLVIKKTYDHNRTPKRN